MVVVLCRLALVGADECNRVHHRVPKARNPLYRPNEVVQINTSCSRIPLVCVRPQLRDAKPDLRSTRWVQFWRNSAFRSNRRCSTFGMGPPATEAPPSPHLPARRAAGRASHPAGRWRITYHIELGAMKLEDAQHGPILRRWRHVADRLLLDDCILSADPSALCQRCARLAELEASTHTRTSPSRCARRRRRSVRATR